MEWSSSSTASGATTGYGNYPLHVHLSRPTPSTSFLSAREAKMPAWRPEHSHFTESMFAEPYLPATLPMDFDTVHVQSFPSNNSVGSWGSPSDLPFTGSWVDQTSHNTSYWSPAPARLGEQPEIHRNAVPYEQPFSTCLDKCQPIAKQAFFECGWKHCKHPGPFTRKSVLMRHIETQHISPRSFECPADECGKSFNRKDNRDEHYRRVHCVVCD